MGDSMSGLGDTVSESKSIIARKKGNELFRSAASGLAPIIRLGRYEKAITHYKEALENAENEDDQSSACKNLAIAYHTMATLVTRENEIDQRFLHFRKCINFSNKAFKYGVDVKSEDWKKDMYAKYVHAFEDAFELILSLGQRDCRIKLLHQFSTNLASSELAQVLRQLTIEYFRISEEALGVDNYRTSLDVLTEVYTPLMKLEELSDTHNDSDLQDFVCEMKDNVFKNRCLSESVKMRLLADELINTVNSNSHVEGFDVDKVWQAIDYYRESIVLIRGLDLELEAKCLTKLGFVYHKVLLDQRRAKEVLMRALQLAQTLEPRNFNEEQWFRDASMIISKYQREQKLREQREWSATREKYLQNLKPDLELLKKKFETLSIQKVLKWLYTEHPPKHLARFSVNIQEISSAPGENVRKLLAKAIVYYHPDKIDIDKFGMKYKVWSEEITKRLSAKYEMFKLSS